MDSSNNMKDSVIIYGVGNFFQQYEDDLQNDYEIVALCDKNKKGFYKNYDIIEPKMISNYCDCKVIIMLMNVQSSLDVARQLNKKLNVLSQNILFGLALYENRVFRGNNITYDEYGEGKLKLNIKGIECSVGSVDEFNNVHEVLEEEIYHYYINNNKKDIVLDIGMNIGSASLYFQREEKVSKIYAFEPFPETYMMAQYNLKKANETGEKVEIYNYGLSNVNEQRVVQFNPYMTCGQSTISEITLAISEKYVKEGFIDAAKSSLVQIEVKKVTNVLNEIIKKWPEENIVIKMDCEGEEYAIIEDLYNFNLLQRINMIMLEWHYKGKDILLDFLKKAGFSYWCMDKPDNLGLIYAIRL